VPIWHQATLIACLVQRTARSEQAVSDFTGSVRSRIRRGDLVITRLACRPGYEPAVASSIRAQQRRARRTWLTLWQESPADRAIAAHLKATQIATKILAGSELLSVWTTGAPPESVALPEPESWTMRPLKIWLPSVTKAKQALARVGETFVGHYSSQYNQSQSWSATSLRGYSDDSRFIAKPSEMPRSWKKQHAAELTWPLTDTSLRAQLPEMEALIKSVPGLKHRIRIMKLRASGVIKRHSDAIDKETGIAPGKLLRIHVPLVTNAGVHFTVWRLNGQKERAHMAEGEVWYLDTRKPHEVVNHGAKDRIHLVMDVVLCPELLAMLK
jgi:hypothetical protein